MVELAAKYDLFVICDEVYQNIIYNGAATKSLAEIIGDVPALNMRGISKEMPWPGSRCGWVEVYNADKDEMFARYVASVVNAKMLEVCSTTLPQLALPRLMEHPEYQSYLDERIRRYEKFSNIAYDTLKDVDGLMVNRTNGAFYMSVAFEEGRINGRQFLEIENPQVRTHVENLVNQEGVAPDKRFVYYLLGATGICVVPLSSFATELQGFRVTLLERDENRFRMIFSTMADAIRAYLASA